MSRPVGPSESWPVATPVPPASGALSFESLHSRQKSGKALYCQMNSQIVSAWPIRPEQPGATSGHIAYGHGDGRVPWAYARPRAAFWVGLGMEPRSSGVLGMFRRSRFNLRARSKAPRPKITRNSGRSLPMTPATWLKTAPAAPANGWPAIAPPAAPLVPETTTFSSSAAIFLVANRK